MDYLVFGVPGKVFKLTQTIPMIPRMICLIEQSIF